MTSRASISSEMRVAPSSAVKPAPTWAAKATPAMSGVTSLVLAQEATRPVKDWAPICSRPLKPWRPTSVPVKNDIEKITKIIPPPTMRAPAPTVMSLMRLNTTANRLGRRAAGIWTSTFPKKPSWRPTSSREEATASTGLRIAWAGEAIDSELLRNQSEVEGGHYEVGEEDE